MFICLCLLSSYMEFAMLKQGQGLGWGLGFICMYAYGKRRMKFIRYLLNSRGLSIILYYTGMIPTYIIICLARD
jgi:hypothetical protein